MNAIRNKDVETNIRSSDKSDRNHTWSWVTGKYKSRGQREVVRLRNLTEDKRAFRRMLTSADQGKPVLHWRNSRVWRHSRVISSNLGTLKYSVRGRGGRQPEVKCSVRGTNEHNATQRRPEVATVKTGSFLEICSPPRTVLSNKSRDKVDFHVLFQYKPRSLSFTTNTFASTQLSLSQSSFFLFNPHPISYTRIDFRKNRVVVRDWFD